MTQHDDYGASTRPTDVGRDAERISNWSRATGSTPGRRTA